MQGRQAGRRNKASMDERRALIAEEVNRNLSLQVSDICKMFNVSEVTARGDLAALEKMGRLRRTHGGAASISRVITVSYPDQRMNSNVEAKRSVAQRAADLVADGDSLFVDTGTTTLEFIKCLCDKREITIVTNDLAIAMFADSSLPNADVLLLGGVLRKNHRYITGTLTKRNLDSIFADKAFLATDSFTPGRGFTTEYMANADAKYGMIAHATKRIMLMDSSKIRPSCFLKFANLDDFDMIVTDCDVNDVLHRECERLGCTVDILETSPGKPLATDTAHDIDEPGTRCLEDRGADVGDLRARTAQTRYTQEQDNAQDTRLS